MKKALKNYCLGFLTATILMSGIAYAANTTTLYNVIANGIKIVIDGQKINPTDANGKTVEPIIYNGTTYLPVRAVANALGKAVYWDGPNYTVYLGNMDGKLEYPTVMLDDLTNIGSGLLKTDELIDNYGNNYNYAFCNNYNNKEGRYLLNMRYSRFRGTLYVPRGYSQDDTYYLTIIADGKNIYKSPEMSKTSAPVDIDIDVTGCNDFRIIFSDTAYSVNYIGFICLGNAGFYQ